MSHRSCIYCKHNFSWTVRQKLPRWQMSSVTTQCDCRLTCYKSQSQTFVFKSTTAHVYFTYSPSPLSPLFFLVRSMWSFSWMRICLSLGSSLMNGCLRSCSVLGLWLWLFTRQLSMKDWNFFDLKPDTHTIEKLPVRAVWTTFSLDYFPTLPFSELVANTEFNNYQHTHSPLLWLESGGRVAWNKEEGSHWVHVTQR